MERPKDNILAKILQPIIVVMVCSFITLTAFGQMTPTTYTDIWVDANTGTLYGMGVTDEGYNAYNHQAGAIATLNSPNGRVSSVDTGLGGSYACATSYLIFDLADMGEYSLSTEYYDYCPIALVVIGYGFGSGSAIGGASQSYYAKKACGCILPGGSDTHCDYEIISPCSVACKRTASFRRNGSNCDFTALPNCILLTWTWFEVGSTKVCLPAQSEADQLSCSGSVCAEI